MSDVVRLLKRVHQTRAFLSDPVSPEVVQDLLDVARWTGSARNVQPWHFVVLDDRELLDELASLGPSAAFFASAPLVIGILIDQQTHTPAFDEARVVERLFVAAHAAGLGAGIGTFAPPNIPKASALVGAPEPFTLHAGVAVGSPAPRVSESRGVARKPLTEITHHNRFGAAWSQEGTRL